jgi:hypothetical protein
MTEEELKLINLLNLTLQFNASIVQLGVQVLSSIDNRDKVIPTADVIKEFRNISKSYEKEAMGILRGYKDNVEKVRSKD